MTVTIQGAELSPLYIKSPETEFINTGGFETYMLSMAENLVHDPNAYTDFHTVKHPPLLSQKELEWSSVAELSEGRQKQITATYKVISQSDGEVPKIEPETSIATLYNTIGPAESSKSQKVVLSDDRGSSVTFAQIGDMKAILINDVLMHSYNSTEENIPTTLMGDINAAVKKILGNE